jgi:hypothetical protein
MSSGHNAMYTTCAFLQFRPTRSLRLLGDPAFKRYPVFISTNDLYPLRLSGARRLIETWRLFKNFTVCTSSPGLLTVDCYFSFSSSLRIVHPM